jgi:hypothetical protein
VFHRGRDVGLGGEGKTVDEALVEEDAERVDVRARVRFAALRVLG